MEMSHRRRPAERTTDERAAAVYSSEEKPKKNDDCRLRSCSSSWPLEQEERGIWLICLVIRAINAVMVQTYFNPDEHWQSLEVAHRLTFGYNSFFCFSHFNYNAISLSSFLF
jgi:Alg9-like mannosyltransferase family